MLFVTFPASNYAKILQIKRRYSINESDAFYSRLFYPVPSCIIIVIVTINKRSRYLPVESLISCFHPMAMFFHSHTSKIMITLFVEENNPLTPTFYNSFISNLQFHQLKCPCGHAGGLSVHGYYNRFIKTSEGKLPFRICRVVCEVCGKTHALLLSSMVPYSQLSFADHLQIIEAYEADAPTATLLHNSDCMDESTIRHVIRRYRRHWKQRLISHSISIYSVVLVYKCGHEKLNNL